MSSDRIPTPTLDKIAEAKDRSQAIGPFLDWLRSGNGGGVQLVQWREIDEDVDCPRLNCEGGEVYNRDSGARENCPKCQGNAYVTRKRETWVQEGRTTEQLLAAYFDIDLAAAERERDAIYQAMSAAAASA